MTIEPLDTAAIMAKHSKPELARRYMAARAENVALREQIQRVRALYADWSSSSLARFKKYPVPEMIDDLGAALDGDQPKPDSRCTGDAGTRPYWMSPDQYDPCRCTLPAGHEGLHQCEHSDQPKPSEQP